MQKYQNQRKRTQAPRKAYRLIKHLHIRDNRPITGRANPGSSERDLVSVSVKGKARADKQCINNNNR